MEFGVERLQIGCESIAISITAGLTVMQAIKAVDPFGNHLKPKFMIKGIFKNQNFAFMKRKGSIRKGHYRHLAVVGSLTRKIVGIIFFTGGK